jgi:hypothetical protein
VTTHLCTTTTTHTRFRPESSTLRVLGVLGELYAPPSRPLCGVAGESLLFAVGILVAAQVYPRLVTQAPPTAMRF